MRTLTARPLICAAGVLLLAGLAAGCSGGAEPVSETRTPEEALALAQRTLDETTGLELSLATPGLPDGVQGISGADGAWSSAPAFEGTLDVIVADTSFSVPVISVDDTVYATLPLTDGYQDIDPAEYNAPDPAFLVAGDQGFASLLPATTEVNEGDTVRGGDDNTEVLTTYVGVVPGAAMKEVIPSAVGQEFQATYEISADGELRKATLVGEFYPDSEAMTYTLTLEGYGAETEIAAPATTP